jgi:hypothetical protein
MDGDWSQQRKLEWVKEYTAKVLTVLNKGQKVKQAT